MAWIQLVSARKASCNKINRKAGESGGDGNQREYLAKTHLSTIHHLELGDRPALRNLAVVLVERDVLFLLKL